MKVRKKKISKITKLHCIKLLVRSVLLTAGISIYLVDKKAQQTSALVTDFGKSIFFGITWLLLMVDMLSRFFPNKMESMGCQKQFSCNYLEKGNNKERIKPHTERSVWAVAIAWIILNAGIGAMYFAHWIDQGILWLICLAYSVCDMICILFFCPFQTWFMKNKCCTTCRIYNWDFAMMFTPLVFVKGFWGHCLLVCAVMLLIRWEVTYHRHPEWFSEETNDSLSCKNCKERLCSQKTQLRNFHRIQEVQRSENDKTVCS